ncbi:Undecaprenyl-diphosphatase [Roseovarius pacificus]|uniref:Undecaprenyl-diphosphatase n=1 Tax=Roseovarius pacificus TaxID=337701 RepID=A0A1M7J2Q0_9RHOB|nr:undecaprenyl-diphosphate phosphatase [Roseovarius pacificus]GGO61758.1 undecaprenyl-diphosphatase 1 [Roseovarius pacificus]SHM47364.1 Undecaprenyl-diphosphatase [Roseovarius pacificus]
MSDFQGGTPLLHLIVLAVVQGITEFLPISSSAHLILVPVFTGWADQGLSLDVAMHIGTLVAVVLYFRRDVAMLLTGAVDVARRRSTPAARLTLQIIAATLPVVVAGFLLKDRIESDWRSPVLIMVTTAAFGVLLWTADRRADRAEGTIDGLTWRDVALIGAAQALALVPGVSRSGITMTVALLLGQRRPEAARFSLLLSIPTTAAAGFLGAMDLVGTQDAALRTDALIAGGLAFLSALAAIAGLMAWLRRASFTPFVIYRLVLAGVLAAMLALGWLPAA